MPPRAKGPPGEVPQEVWVVISDRGRPVDVDTYKPGAIHPSYSTHRYTLAPEPKKRAARKGER
jgi:hypothetical protein